MSKPNILLIVADDMGYGDFGVFNNQMSCTPTLDRLVNEGVCLTQHYSASPVCAPARAALMTGRYPHRTGSIDTLEARGLDRLHVDETTLADILSGHGYATGLIGKWHNGNLDARYHPNARGYDEFVGFQGGWNPYYRWRLDANGSTRYSDGRYLTNVFTEEAVSFIDRHHNTPFFLQVSYNAPHFPLEAPEAVAHKYIAMGYSIGVSLIYAMIEIMDAGVQRLLQVLESYGIADNTIVIFTSDNGPAFHDWYGLTQERYNHGYNGHKGTTYEGGIRVPLIIRWNDGLPADVTRDAMGHFTDWLPTLLTLCDIDIPADLNLDGQDISAVLRGEDGQVNPKRFWQWNRYTPMLECNSAMRDGDWKLVYPQIPEAMAVADSDIMMDNAIKYYPEGFSGIVTDPLPDVSITATPSPLLFNIADDPYEEHDLAEEQPARVNTMLSEMETWFADVEADRQRVL